jgi:hypothetical protein
MTPTLIIRTNIETAHIIGAWVQQAIELIPGRKYIDIDAIAHPHHTSPGYIIRIDVIIDQRCLKMEYHNNKLEYWIWSGKKRSIDLADPDAAEQFQKNIANDAKTEWFPIASHPLLTEPC